MINFIRRTLALKIAILANLILLVVIFMGGSSLFVQEASQFDKQLKAKGKIVSMLGAKSISRILEEAIDNGVLTLDDVMDTNYIEIPGSTPPKYHTRYDAYTDKAILSLQDEIVKDPEVLYAVALDINGYLPTHNSNYSLALTGDTQKDLSRNRAKRFFKDTYALHAGKNKQMGYMQKYERDTGETVWDISSPIYIKGKHWGCFRVGFELDTANQAKNSFLFALGSILLVILLVSMISVFLLIKSTLKPLTDFTRIASDLADGNMEEKIEWDSDDEIGKLADAMERLRISLKAAMDRLSR